MTRTPEEGRVWGGENGSERTARRRAQLIETAFEILATEGWREVTVERVCSQTRLNKRYFYESFPDVEALAQAVIENLRDSLVADLIGAAARGAALPKVDFAEMLIGVIVDNLTDDPRRARVLFGRLAATPELEQRRTSVIEMITEAVMRVGVEYHHLSFEPIARMTAAVLVGALGECTIQWLDGIIDMSRERLIAEYTAFAVQISDGFMERRLAAQQALDTAKHS